MFTQMLLIVVYLFLNHKVKVKNMKMKSGGQSWLILCPLVDDMKLRLTMKEQDQDQDEDQDQDQEQDKEEDDGQASKMGGDEEEDDSDAEPGTEIVRSWR